MVLLCALSLISKGLELQESKAPVRTAQEVEGWTVMLDNRLSTTNKALGDQAIKYLKSQLIQIQITLPAKKVERLRTVKIHIDESCGDMRSPVYHPSPQWLKNNGYQEDLAKGVHLPDARYFTSNIFQTQQPWAVMHELAHAIHDQDLGFDNKEVVTLWEKFKEKPTYKASLHIDGTPRDHYGRTNQMEFFAEMTESYLGMNDFFPFNRAELKAAEPEIYRFLEKFWRESPE